MWIYLKAIFGSLYPKFVKITVVSAVLFIVIMAFIRLGFTPNKSTPTTTEIMETKREMLYTVFDRPEYKTKQGKQFAKVQKGVYCGLFGQFCNDDPKNIRNDFSKSLFGYIGNIMIIPLANPPASGIAYIQESIQEAGFTPKAIAAEGIGFASIRPFLAIWKAFRNMAYLILVIAIIVIGFMIMFQFKIDPHSIISIENALPRIVATLLVITFSYAIAGLLIDATYLIILFVFQIFSSTGLAIFRNSDLQSTYLTGNILSLVGSGDNVVGTNIGFTGIYLNALINIFSLIPFWLKNVLIYVMTVITILLSTRFGIGLIPLITSLMGNTAVAGEVQLVIGGSIEAKIGNILGSVFSMGLGLLLGIIVVFLGLILFAIVGILFLYFRIVFLLIGAYVQIIIRIMFAPILLMREIIPGQKSFAYWLKVIFGHLMVFPTVIALLLVVQLIQNVGFDPRCTGFSSYLPGYCKTHFSLPLLYGFNTSALAMIISGAFLFAIPDLTRKVVKSIAGESSIPVGPGILFGGAAALTGTAIGSISQLDSLNRAITGKSGLGGGFGNIGRILTGKAKSTPKASTDGDGGEDG